MIDGNDGKGGEAQRFFDEPVSTRFIRFEVHTFVGLHPCMGVEVYGCAPGWYMVNFLGVNRINRIWNEPALI